MNTDTSNKLEDLDNHEFKEFYCESIHLQDCLSATFCFFKREDEMFGEGFTLREILNEFSRRYPDKLLIEVQEVEVQTDPRINVYNIALTRQGGSWQETFGSPDLANKFLRGVTAGASLFANTLLSVPHVG